MVLLAHEEQNMITSFSLVYLALGMMVPLTGTVVDSQGKPVAEAKVWLGDTHAARKGPEVLAATETDEQGHFQLQRDDQLTGRGRDWSPSLWAYKGEARLAFQEFKGKLPATDEPVTLTLGPPVRTSVQILNPDGTPAAGAKVRVAVVKLNAPRPPDKLLDVLSTTSDAEGSVTIGGIDPENITGLDVTVKGQVVQCLPIDDGSPTVTLRPVGRLKVKVVADDPKAVKGWTITARSHPTEPGYRGLYTVHWVRNTTGDDGRATLLPIAQGQVLWDIEPPKDSAYLVLKTPAVMIIPGETQEVEIKVSRGIPVEGIVREEPGGAPIAGIEVRLDSFGGTGRNILLPPTDAQGRFSSVVLPGTTRFSFNYPFPKEYFLPPGVQHWVDFEVKEGENAVHAIDVPALRKAATISGRVLDENGKPVAGTRVLGTWKAAEFGNHAGNSSAEVEADGRFVLGSLAPKSQVDITTSAGVTHEAESVTVPSAGEGGPIAITLRKRPTFVITGQVLDSGGKPLEEARIQVKIRSSDNTAWFDGPFPLDEEIRSGPDGRFRTPDQIPVGNYEYTIVASAAGYEQATSAPFSRAFAEPLTITLRRSLGHREVAGEVVDSGGKPIAGAVVFLSGGVPKRIQRMTDADGRYRIPGVPDAPAFLFASKEGYHFLGRRVEADDAAIPFTLRRLDEAATQTLQRVVSPVTRAEERAIALALIDDLKKGAASAPEWGDPQAILLVTAMLDPDRMLAMIENQVVTADSRLITAVAIGLYDRDPNRALELLDGTGDPAIALDLFDRLGETATDPFRRELLDRALRISRAADDPARTAQGLAQVASRLFDIGEPDRAAAIVREAQVALDKPRGPFPDPRYELVPVLARVNLAAALALMDAGNKPKPPKPAEGVEVHITEVESSPAPDRIQHERERFLAAIVKEIAPTQPTETRRLLEMIHDERPRAAARRVAAIQMAATDLAAAEALQPKVRNSMLWAILPAVAAKSRAATDPEGAKALLRESVERLSKIAETTQGRRSPSVALARLVPLANRVDPDRAADLLWLALSRRSPVSPVPEPSPVMPDVRRNYAELGELAVLTARYDRSAAEVVFAPVEQRFAGLDDNRWGLENEVAVILRAAAALDARIAKRLVEAIPDDPPPPENDGVANAGNFRRHSKSDACLAVAETLALPPSLRLREPLIRYSVDSFLNILEDGPVAP
jgi:protocatechuate 3,4-dioxygenase beta subunit